MKRDGLPNPREIVIDVSARHTKHAPTPFLHISRAARVMLQLLRRPMRVAIDFDDQLGSDACEVSNVGSDRMLTPEFRAAQRAPPNITPKQRF